MALQVGPTELRDGLTRDLGPAPSFAQRCLVEAACIAAAEMERTNDPAWHRAFCEALQRLHGAVPTAVIPEDDPWKLALGGALDGLTGKIATVDVWHLLGLHPYDRSMQQQRRLTEVMRVLGWRRKVIRHNAHRVGRGFRRGLDTRTIFVFRCPVSQEIYYIGHNQRPDKTPQRACDAKLPADDPPWRRQP
jgi:hypothetical protein